MKTSPKNLPKNVLFRYPTVPLFLTQHPSAAANEQELPLASTTVQLQL